MSCELSYLRASRLAADPWRVVCLVAALLAGCQPYAHLDGAAASREQSSANSFDVLYKTNCAGCHGLDGKLGPAPPLNDPIFLAIVPGDELLRMIRGGRRGTLMPHFAREAGGSLSDEQVKALAAGIKPRWASSKTSPQDLPAYAVTRSDGPDTAGSPEAGAKTFARACAECHGQDGKGNPTDPRPRKIHEPAFLALISDQALRRIIITGRPDLGMPNFAGKDGRPDDFQPLTNAEISDLVALLSSWRAPQTAGPRDQSAAASTP